MEQAEKKHRINDGIAKVNEVYLVGDNVVQGVYPFEEAYKIADDLNLDLVEVNSSASPIICKIFDYQKFQYQQKKKQKVQQKSSKVETKTLRFGPQTDEHDYQFKLKHAIEFLKGHNKVRAYVFFKGRSIIYKEQGELILTRLCNDLLEVGTPTDLPKMNGKNMEVTILPKK